MNYGVVLPIWQLTIADAESLTVRAEELGLDGVFVPDHILAKPATTQHYGGHWPDPFSLLAYLAGRTRRIRLGASVIVLPYRHALVTAKASPTVDQAPLHRTPLLLTGRQVVRPLMLRRLFHGSHPPVLVPADPRSARQRRDRQSFVVLN